MSAQNDVGIGFVIAKQDVVTRLEAFDEVVFQQQRFRFRTRHRGFDSGDMRYHQLRARRQSGFLKIRRYALLEVDRLTDIDDLALFVQHPVNTGLRGQVPAKSFCVEY